VKLERAIRARARAIVDLMQSLSRAHPSVGRPVVTGFSQGGMLSFTLAALHPQEIRASIPIAGRLPEGISPAKPPAWLEVIALHGRADDRILFSAGEQSVQRLSGAGFRARMHAFDGVGHTITAPMQRTLLTTLEDVLRRAP
jgi:phospholipase/carboxylesterase